MVSALVITSKSVGIFWDWQLRAVSNSPLLCRFTPTVSTSVLCWWNTRRRLTASTGEWPPAGWRTSWSLTTATSPLFPCTSASPNSACPSKPQSQWSWSALGQELLPSWASSRKEAGSNSKVFTAAVESCVCLNFYNLVSPQGYKEERRGLQMFQFCPCAKECSVFYTASNWIKNNK